MLQLVLIRKPLPCPRFPAAVLDGLGSAGFFLLQAASNPFAAFKAKAAPATKAAKPAKKAAVKAAKPAVKAVKPAAKAAAKAVKAAPKVRKRTCPPLAAGGGVSKRAGGIPSVLCSFLHHKLLFYKYEKSLVCRTLTGCYRRLRLVLVGRALGCWMLILASHPPKYPSLNQRLTPHAIVFSELSVDVRVVRLILVFCCYQVVAKAAPKPVKKAATKAMGNINNLPKAL